MPSKAKTLEKVAKWIQNKYQINSSQGWETIILSQVNDEKLAFDLFFELFEQFNFEILHWDKTALSVEKQKYYCRATRFISLDDYLSNLSK